ncbi:MAG: hypothetical protein KC503_23065 [Myxococcales bacterium]|nr:hypothetical protein [Myxococcales bacterium]
MVGRSGHVPLLLALLLLASGCTSRRALIARGDHYAACRRSSGVHTPVLARSLRRALALRLRVHAPTRAELRALLGAASARLDGERLVLVGARLDSRDYQRGGVRVTVRYALELWQGAHIAVAQRHRLRALALLTGELATPLDVKTRSTFHVGALARNLVRLALLPLALLGGRGAPGFERVHSRYIDIRAKRIEGAPLASALHAVLRHSCRGGEVALPLRERTLCLLDTQKLDARRALSLALRAHYTLYGAEGRCRVFDDVTLWSLPPSEKPLAERINALFAGKPKTL